MKRRGKARYEIAMPREREQEIYPYRTSTCSFILYEDGGVSCFFMPFVPDEKLISIVSYILCLQCKFHEKVPGEHVFRCSQILFRENKKMFSKKDAKRALRQPSKRMCRKLCSGFL